MRASAARRAAREVITRVRERDAYAHETLDAVLREKHLDARDAGLATRLAYGVIGARGTLEKAVMRGLSEGTGIEDLVMDALVIGAYEVLFSATAVHAAVSETVELVRDLQPRAAGLANAAMRRLVESAGDFPWGDADTDTAALARKFGHPDWLTELLVADLGREGATEMLAADMEPAPFFIAQLPHVGSLQELSEALVSDGADPQPCVLEGCLVAGEPSAARRSKTVTERKALVMDAGAQLAVEIADDPEAEVLVEVGAGRGSKSLLAASKAAARRQSLRLVAADLHGFKLEALLGAAQALGLPAIETVTVDATSPDSDFGIADGEADVVLIDAPCSGLGTLRRHPDRIWRAKPEEIESLAALGAALLERCTRLVKPGGFVVYSTCTVARRENEDVIEGFLASAAGRGFELAILADAVPIEWQDFVTADGCFRSHPRAGGPDGHFVARLTRVQ
ncbi:MAG TPA: transcription antitermination factor NusB [Coriobacteriia bacterium]|nr:transcription antitermination factor NusB [Coriobacteriia bacterium]